MRTRPIQLCIVCLAMAVLLAAHVAPAEPPDEQKVAEAQLLAPDGIPYATQNARDVMQMEAKSGNLVQNGSFETGRHWPYGWEATDGLTTFWVPGGTDGRRCLRICTDVLDAQWKARSEEVRAAVDEGARRAGGDPQSLPESPVPPPPDRIPTQPPYYDTVAGLHGVHYRSHYIECAPGAVYRFSIDARTEAEGEPKVFIKGFFDQRMKTKDGVQVVRRDAYQAPIFLAPCDGQWRRYARLFRPSQSKSKLGGEELETEWLQVQIYAYWKPGDYYFDNVRLEIVGLDEPEPKKKVEQPKSPKKPEPAPRVGEDEFPVFNP